MIYQNTLAAPVQYDGETLHSGHSVLCRLTPADPDTGIIFSRNNFSIKASCENVTSTTFSTRLGVSDTSIATIEHIMAALYGTSIDNVHIKVDGNEIPILDGSAQPWIDAILAVGLQKQNALRKTFVVKESFVWKDENGSFLSVYPADHFSVDMTIDYSHPLIGIQKYYIVLNEESFIQNIAPARTFGFFDEIEVLHKKGLARGACLDNTIVFDNNKILNKETLRFPNECVRHKILDFCGDLLLLGRFLGNFKGYKTGHTIHNAFLRAFLKNGTYEVIS